jgi:hypothetical protein
MDEFYYRLELLYLVKDHGLLGNCVARLPTGRIVETENWAFGTRF